MQKKVNLVLSNPFDHCDCFNLRSSDYKIPAFIFCIHLKFFLSNDPEKQRSLTGSSSQKWSQFRLKFFEPEPGRDRNRSQKYWAFLIAQRSLKRSRFCDRDRHAIL